VIAPCVIVITDPAFSDELLTERAERLLDAVPPGSIGLQVRDKARPARQVFNLAERLKSICARHGAPVYVNDRIDIALAIAAEGVHLGDGSAPIEDARRLLGRESFLSVAAHRLEDVERAHAKGATAALLSPVFATPGKGPPQGTRFISEARGRCPHLCLYALGGIDEKNAGACFEAGADGIAVIRAVWSAVDPVGAAISLVASARDRLSPGHE
jgi:thiamine-phosphate pyrophosphorylase